MIANIIDFCQFPLSAAPEVKPPPAYGSCLSALSGFSRRLWMLLPEGDSQSPVETVSDFARSLPKNSLLALRTAVT